jgi:D-glycero-alpha-D-manno-heptose-7-phosphate kinase
MPAVTVRAPTRLDFGGGWTDVPPYSNEQGGRVCNVAIARYATVHLASSGAGSLRMEHAFDSALARAAVRRSRLAECTASIQSDFPVGAGLGGSSAAGVALAAAIRVWRGESLDDRDAIAEESRATEAEELGIPGGRQDHYAASWGGALDLTFGAQTGVQRIALNREACDALESRCVVVYTGESRISGDTITAVMEAYAAREPRVISALQRMKDLAGDMASALVAGDIDALGAAVGEHWVHQRSLHPAIPTPLIDRLLAAARQAGALGGKALGASGGGCVLAIAARDRADEVREAMAALGEPLEFRIDEEGVRVLHCES